MSRLFGVGFFGFWLVRIYFFLVWVFEGLGPRVLGFRVDCATSHMLQSIRFPLRARKVGKLRVNVANSSFQYVQSAKVLPLPSDSTAYWKRCEPRTNLELQSRKLQDNQHVQNWKSTVPASVSTGFIGNLWGG